MPVARMQVEAPSSNHVLPPPNPPGGLYRTVLVHGNTAYVSGHLPIVDGKVGYMGKVGAECSLEDAKAAARASAISCLSSLAAKLGSLDKIEQVLKLVGFVASAQDFVNQTAVVDAASNAVLELLGSRGHHARSAVGVFQLPRNVPVEVEMICAIRA